MKLVKCLIKCPDAGTYSRVIERLCFYHLSHDAKFESPNVFIVTAVCPVIEAERNLDKVLEELQLYAEKKPIMINPEPAPKLENPLHGPYAPLWITDGEGKRVLGGLTPPS